MEKVGQEKVEPKIGDWEVKVTVWQCQARGDKTSAIRRHFEAYAGEDGYPKFAPDRATIAKICKELPGLPLELVAKLPSEVQTYAQRLNPQLRVRPEPRPSDSKHFAELSVTALILASNFESYVDNFGTGFDSAVGDVVYGGSLNDFGDALTVLMRHVDRPLALNLLYHLKGEFPELANISDWDQLTSAKMSHDFIARLKLKANRGDFMGKCPACPDSTANPRLLR